MRYLKTYKIFENEESSAALGPGEKVMILYKLPGTEQRELVPVQIVKKESGTNTYLVSFQVEGNPFYNHKDMVVKGSKIIGPYHQIQEPMSPSYLSQQPTPTDYNPPGNIGGGGVSNDVTLPNS